MSSCAPPEPIFLLHAAMGRLAGNPKTRETISERLPILQGMMTTDTRHSPNPRNDSSFFGLRAPALLPLDVLTNEADLARYVEATTRLGREELSSTLARLEREGLLPLVTGSHLRGEFRLWIDVDPELTSVKFYRIDRTITEEELNGKIVLSPSDATLLAEVPHPRLIMSAHDISKYAVDDASREAVVQLLTNGKRITTIGDNLVTWDQATDKKVWTTNIDTVHFLRALRADNVFERTDITSALEVGVGGGALSKSLVQNIASLKEHGITDISAYALLCARRNISPVLTPEQSLHLYLGKGIKSFEAKVDLLIVNPPYIPHIEKHDAVDPYRGTGLIEEVIEKGLTLLNPNNPKACVYMGMSSLGEKDFATYLAAHPEVKVSLVGERLKVPLKIFDVNSKKDWIEFLEREHGLIRSQELLKTSGFEFWHEIFVVKLERDYQ